MPRNASWTAEELILALDLYFRLPSTKASEHDPRIQELSRILDGRNPAAVYMKLRNFLRFEQSPKRHGLARGGKLEQAIWRGFAPDRALLRRTARQIIELRTRGRATPQESFRL